MSRPHVALNMIVKNESHVIGELIHLVAPLISTWNIVDTGSSDDTPRLIEESFKRLGIPGRLFHRPWKNFGFNRSQALALAKGSADYHWVMDADDWLCGTPNFSALTAASYYMKFGKDFTYYRQQLFRDDLPWRYEGVLHEYPTCGQQVEIGRLEGDYYIESRRLGARNKDPQKYLKDAAVLEEALKEEPGNARYWFYLGQSYFDAGEFAKALNAYRHRVTLGGWEEEVYYAQYRVGMSMIQCGASEAEVIGALVKAFQLRPSRAESLHTLAFYLRQQNQFNSAAMFARAATLVGMPADVLFVDAAVYEYKALDELSVSGYYSIPHRADGYNACLQLLKKSDLPQDVAERTKANLEYYRKNLGFS